MKIRPYRTDDLGDLYAISLATGHAGEDASSLMNDPSLIGHIYAASYASLKPELAWVAVDEKGVCGYIIGVEDTEAWENQLEEKWWPGLRETYVNPADGGQSLWTPDESHIKMIFHPMRTPLQISRSYPAHAHLNLLPRTQKKGVGARLLRRWLSAAADLGVEAVHVAVNRQNVGGLRFWRKQNFTEIDPLVPNDGTVWMGRHVPETPDLGAAEA